MVPTKMVKLTMMTITTPMIKRRWSGLGQKVIALAIAALALSLPHAVTGANAFEGCSKRERRPSWQFVASISNDVPRVQVRDKEFLFQLRQHYEDPTFLDYLHSNDLVGSPNDSIGGIVRSPFFDSGHQQKEQTTSTNTRRDNTKIRVDWCRDAHPFEKFYVKWSNKAFRKFKSQTGDTQFGRWAVRHILQLKEDIEHAAHVFHQVAEHSNVGTWAVDTMSSIEDQAERYACQAQRVLKPIIQKYTSAGSAASAWFAGSAGSAASAGFAASAGTSSASVTTVAATGNGQKRGIPNSSTSRQATATAYSDNSVKPQNNAAVLWWRKAFPLLSAITAINPQKVLLAASAICGRLISDIWKDGTSINPRVMFHNVCRDSGMFRVLVNFLTAMQAPLMAVKNPSIVRDFIHLSKKREHIQYGMTSKSQQMDVYLPDNQVPRGLVFFVHGGAWGSGMPWMYRLVAAPFLARGLAVAVVGYRTYPDGDASTQVEDLELASAELTKRYPHLCEEKSELGVCVVGHSSGAHISLLMMAERAKRHVEIECMKLQQGLNLTGMGSSAGIFNDEQQEQFMRIDAFVGMSGPYDVSRHFDFEAGRGLEELSPMKPVCGFTRSMFRHHSPIIRLSEFFCGCSEAMKQSLHNVLPNLALVHGVEDDTVPLSSTWEAAELLRMSGISKCEEIYLSETGHCDTVMQLMFGGKTQDVVVDWLERLSQQRHQQNRQQYDPQILAAAKSAAATIATTSTSMATDALTPTTTSTMRMTTTTGATKTARAEI